MTDFPQGRVVAAIMTTVVLWASAFIVIRDAGSHFSPGGMALLRMLVGTVTLGAVVAWKGFRWPGRRAWALIVTYGLAWFGAYNVVLNDAERHIDAGTSALLVNIAPLIVTLLAGIALGEGFPRSLMIGAPVAFGGVLLIGFSTSTGSYDVRGVLLAVLAALLYAAGTLMQKRALTWSDTFSCTFLAAAIGTAGLLMYAPALVDDVSSAPAASTWSVVYLGVFPTAIAFTTWGYALTHVSAGSLSVSTYVVPAVAIVLSWVFLGEVPGLLTLLGGAVCLLGVGLTRMRRLEPRAEARGHASDREVTDACR